MYVACGSIFVWGHIWGHVVVVLLYLIDLVMLMMMLGKQQINSVWVEAGAELAGALLNAGLVDELVVYLAPKLLGSDARGLCQLPGLTALADAPRFNFSEIRQVGPDVCLHLTNA